MVHRDTRRLMNESLVACPVSDGDEDDNDVVAATATEGAIRDIVT